MIVLGINAYHGDASAALLIDGEVVAAVEEERFSRQKHQAGFPAAAIRWCLGAAGGRVHDVDHVAVSRDPLSHLGPRLTHALRHRSSPRSLWRRAQSGARLLGTRQALAAACDVDPRRLRAQFHRVEHHRAHLASALFCSPFDEAACLSVDGMGDFVSSMWGRGRGNELSVDGAMTFPDSLGIYYTAFTQFLGFPDYGDEYKMMGLAGHGRPAYLAEVRRILQLDDDGRFHLDPDAFVHESRGVDMTWAEGTPHIGRLFSDVVAVTFGPPREPGAEVTERDRDLAASVQARLEEVELELLRRLQARTHLPRVVLAGGVALNCVANGRIRDDTPFEDVWVQPAANDAGTAVGAAQWVWHRVLGHPRTWAMTHAYLGPSYDAEVYEAAVAEAGLHAKHLDDAELCEYVAGRVAEGAVAGWFQGATEFGPRALGNRSIVADPRSPATRDMLNTRIKHREAFRPFAPSVLVEAVGKWFEDDHPSPFMLMTYRVRPERRHIIPAVTHVDGTARVQTVARRDNPRYYDLITAFARRTGVELVLNTSLNEREPMVAHPRDALACYRRNGMDLLVLGNLVVDSVWASA